MTQPDPYAEVRAEFASSLDARVAAMREALEELKDGYEPKPADRLHHLVHSLAGTAISFDAERLAQAAQALERTAECWRSRAEFSGADRDAAARQLEDVAQSAAEYVEALSARPVESAVARLTVVGELSHLISATYDLPAIFRQAIQLVRRVLDFRRASVVLVDEEGGHYVLHTLYDAHRGGFISRDLRFGLEHGLTGQVIRTGQPILVGDLEGRTGILAHAGQRVSAMLVPLRVKGLVIGTLNFGHERPGHYTEADLEWAGVLARQIEMSLQLSSLLSTIARQGEALARERNQLEALIGASDAAIMLVRPDNMVVYGNSAMIRLLGLPREAIVGAKVDRLHDFLAASLEDASALAPQVEALRGETPLKDRITLALPSHAVYQRVIAPVRDENGAVIGSLLQYRDVTHEAELERMKSEFVSVVSHELRTPMTSIRTSLALMLAGAAGPLEASARELLEIAARNSDRLIALVNDLLDLSRIESGRVPLKLEPVAVRDAVRGSVEMVGAFAAERGVALAVQPPQEEVNVTGVRDRIIQVLVNLVANAVKFSPRQTQVLVRWWRDPESATIEVSDEGPGIPQDKLEKVFEPFTQLSDPMTRDQGGAGLGLTISRGIVQALNGKIWVESKPGTGARFYVQLPLGNRPEVSGGDRTQPPHRDATILLTHSDPDWGRVCATTFRLEGWHVVQAHTGAEALGLLRDTRVDLLVVGLELSDTHGLSVLEQARQEPRNCDVPAVIVGEGDVGHVLDYGADAWSSGDVTELLDHTRRLLTAPLRPVILYVEDDPSVRESIRKALKRSGYACLAAAEPRQALELLKIRRPALVITDIRMPDMDGLSFLQTVRNDPSLAGIPAIVLTAYVLPGVPEQISALSARLLRKPADLAELLAEIRLSLGE
jgi:signal transduction histidine kinase/CheY-like chemotaxis protein/HPt (histidine-containing phosphotransfer) domain-containing protein